TVARLVSSVLVLAVPTLAMGGTLPAAARAATRATDVRRRDVAAIYALNTLGAVFGCAIATFWLLERFGTRGTIWSVAAVNLLIAIAAWLAARSLYEDRESDVRVETDVNEMPARSGAAPAAMRRRQTWESASDDASASVRADSLEPLR